LFKEGLKRTNEFKKVFSNGNRKSGKYLILYILSSQQENNRAGFIVKKSLGNAVQRNKIKRRLREIWRQKGIKLIFGCDVIIVAKKEILEASFTEIEQELIRLLPRDNFKIR
jgi:ribonuclease P protein component